MKKYYSLIVLALSFSLMSCNGIGSKDTVVARIGNETLYAEDLDFLTVQNLGAPDSERYKLATENLMFSLAKLSKATGESKSYDSAWKAYEPIVRNRLLTIVYTRFHLMNRLGYTDEELKKYFDEHRGEFDSAAAYMDIREDVAGRYYLSQNQDSLKSYIQQALSEKKDSVKADSSKEDDMKELEQSFVRLHKQAMSQKVKEMMSDLGTVVVEKLVPKDPHKFYEDNKEKFMTAPGYEVYHVAMKDSAVLAKTMVNVKDLESFKAVAATISEKEETADSMGYVGRIKKGHALPYGIGLMPALWPELEEKTTGYISSAIRSVSDSLYHSFYVQSVVPSELKPFDRVEKQLEKMYAEDVASLDPTTVLVSDNGKTVYTKADLLKIFEAEPGIPYNKETHNNIVKMLAQAYVVGEKARQEKVDQSWEYRALMRVARMDFITARYDRVLQMKEPGASQITENLKKYEYLLNRETKYKGRSYEEADSLVEKNLKATVRTNEKLVANMDIWNKTNVFFYDQSKANLAPATTAESFVALGDSAAKIQSFDAAISAYQKVIDLFAYRDTLFRTAVYNLAQTYSDAQKYKKSAACFEAFLQVWPDAPETEKAMFSLGFVLNENLKQNDRALEVLEDFQKRFPKSELKESVDWLVENIKSDGKLAEDLMKKIEAEE